MVNPDRDPHQHQGVEGQPIESVSEPSAPRTGGTSHRGFAGMGEKKQREIASKGGHSVPPEHRSFSKDHALASEAGRKGGQSVPRAARSFSKNRALASAAGHKGALSRNANRKDNRSH